MKTSCQRTQEENHFASFDIKSYIDEILMPIFSSAEKQISIKKGKSSWAHLQDIW